MKNQITKYDHRAVESSWQKAWKTMKLNIENLDRSKRPFYNLMMFPYPSAEGLHVGNMYAFTGSDIYGRFKQMQGYDVFEPIGLDGFGIHSENYALKVGRHPMDHAAKTEQNFYNQLHRIGSMYDWSRTVETYHADYYKWTQWIFIQMFKHGLAHREKASVNWCPSCKTVLADEQVIDGVCERCGNTVEKKLLEQWFFRITAYAEKLLKNLSSLDWSDKVKIAQRNWIGKKEGILITYPVYDGGNKAIGHITCCTTRPDTNFGATFVVLAPEHEFISQILRVIKSERADAIGQYVKEAKGRSEEMRVAEGRKKTGVNTGLYCLNELNNYKMPVYISDFVLMSVGAGAVVGVPGHDKRDYEFAVAFNVPIKRVVKASDGAITQITKIEEVQEKEGTMINSEFLNGLPIMKAKEKMMAHLVKKGWGRRVTTYHLRDWLISRQRYWGPPIPMIYCKKCGAEGKSWFTTKEADSIARNSNSQNLFFGASDVDLVAQKAAGWYPVPDDQLPVILPRIEDYRPGNDGIAPLAKHKEFYETVCPGCGGKAVRETDVSDTFLDSSWYFLRYPSTRSARSDQAAFDSEITKKWLPVHMYTGGAEHSVLHLMYSRFVTMAICDFGYLDFEEPFTRFYAHGLVIKDGAKMSKSKGNVVNPDEYIASHGADALRLYLMFMGPFSHGGDFRDSAMEGMSRWVGRIWRLALGSIQASSTENKDIHSALGKLAQKVTHDIERRHYNTAIAAMMEFTNFVADKGGLLDLPSLKTFILLLAPFAPHLTEELWQQIHGRKASTLKTADSVHRQAWPRVDHSSVAYERAELVIQVNGKLRDKLELSSKEASIKETVERLALSRDRVKSYLKAKPKKVIFVPGRLIDFVA